jgi:hypothetical protein
MFFGGSMLIVSDCDYEIVVLDPEQFSRMVQML